MALVGVELETLVSESDALTTRPPPCVLQQPLPIVCDDVTAPLSTILYTGKKNFFLFFMQFSQNRL